MSQAQLLHLADLLQVLTVGTTIFGYLPQITKMHRSKSSAGLSTQTWLVWTCGTSMTLFYALAHYQYEERFLPLVLAASCNFLLTLWTLAITIWYRPPLETAGALVLQAEGFAEEAAEFSEAERN